MPIWYVFERATGRFAGSGTVEIRTETHDCTLTPLHPAPLAEPEPVYDDETGAWAWRADWAVETDLPMQGQEADHAGQVWVSQIDNNFWPAGVVGPWLPKPTAEVQVWAVDITYVQPEAPDVLAVTGAPGTAGEGRVWHLQTSQETTVAGREPWQAYMHAVWTEVG